jgi:hypothetical protein
VQEPDKAAAMAWYPLDALPEPVVPHERLVLGMVLASLRDGTPVPAVVSLPS